MEVWAAGKIVRFCWSLERSPTSYLESPLKVPTASTLCWSQCSVRSDSAKRYWADMINKAV
jgi:hypothetical protein